jgi:tetratricopeptide (TPR) repeat protein
MHKNRKRILFGILIVLILGGVILSLPPVWSRVYFYTQLAYSSIKYKLFPPQEYVFVPVKNTPDAIETAVQATIASMQTPTPQATSTEILATSTPTATPFPIAQSALLTGISHELQEWNNCGPTTLSMYLSYWRWVSTQDNIAPIVKPNKYDNNVMPYELADFVLENTDLQAIVRVGGDMQTLKELVNAGIPVMIEKGFYVPSTPTSLEGWMGHYELVMGYDDAKQVFITHDSYLPLIVGTAQADGLPFTYNKTNRSFEVPYADFYQEWRAFNFTFLVVYPQDKQNDVTNLLGPLWDEPTAFQIAHDRALAETTSLTDPSDQFFAWFNLGSSLVKQLDYTDADTAYDKAFLLLPTITGDHNPWRMMWYQTGPYFAYYYSGRYTDVIDLATNTLKPVTKPLGPVLLEESYYWRAMAEVAMGDQSSGVADLEKSLEAHPGFGPSISEFQTLGVNP